MPSLGQTIAALKAQRTTSTSPGRSGRLLAVPGFGSNPGQLEMKVHAPAGRSPGAALVVVLHGCTQTAEDYAVPAGWIDLADRVGFVVVAPQQGRGNNSNLCFNWYQSGDIQRVGGEAQSIAQMVAHAIEIYDLDPGRVFVTGLSAGGAMTCVMLAAYPDLFAGGAVIAGLPYGVADSLGQAFELMASRSPETTRTLGDRVRRATDHLGPWPTVSVWHGQSDNLVRPAAGEAVAEQWRQVHGATGAGRVARTPDGRDFLVWMSPGGDPVVELHRIDGLGHGAPVKAAGLNGCGAGSRYTPETGLSSTFEIALGWGLVTRSSEARGVPRASAPIADSAASAMKVAKVSSIETVINDALRVAGLIR